MASVGLGFGATLGATVILFQHVKGESGLIFMLPIYIYLFVVALGTDYNILMIARLREEAREGKDSRAAAAEAAATRDPRSPPPASSWPARSRRSCWAATP